MIHSSHLQMLVGCCISPSCPSSIVRLRRPFSFCQKNPIRSVSHQWTVAYKASPFNSCKENPIRSVCRWGEKRIPSLGSLRSVSSGPSKCNGSDAVQLGSLFVPRFPVSDHNSWSRKRSLSLEHRPQVFVRGFPVSDHNFCLGKPYVRLEQRRPQSNSRGHFVGPSTVIFGEKEFYVRIGAGAERGKKKLLSSGLGSRGRRVVTQSSAAGAIPSQGPQNFWSRLWANFCALCASFASRLQSVRIGWLDLFTMLRIVFIAAGAFGVYIASRRAWEMIRAKADGKSAGAGGGESAEGEGEGGPMQVLARGATSLQTNMGPWSIADMTLGLTAMSKLTEKRPPALAGQEVKDLSQDSNFLLRAQHWRTLSEAVYVKDSASFSLLTGLPESSLVFSEWEPCHETFRPAYAVFVDAPYGAVVLAVRGTSHIIDMLLDTSVSPEPFHSDGNYAHGGFLHAANELEKQVLPHIEKAFRDHGGNQKDLKLVICGHSLGAAVASLVALKLREKFPDLQCWGFCPPACMSLDLAKECKSFTTSFVAGHDLVPRFSLLSLEKLRARIQDFDWDEVERVCVATDDKDWQNIKKGMETFRGLQKAHAETMEKLTTSGEEESLPSKKVKEWTRKALDSQTGEMARSMAKNLGMQTTDLMGGEKGPKEQEGEDGEEGKPPPPPLHPPGRLLVMSSDPPGCGKMPEQRSDVASERGYGSYPTFDEAKNVKWRMLEAEQEEMVEIVVSPWCMSDHMLGTLCEAIGYLQSCCPPAVK